MPGRRRAVHVARAISRAAGGLFAVSRSTASACRARTRARRPTGYLLYRLAARSRIAGPRSRSGAVQISRVFILLRAPARPRPYRAQHRDLPGSPLRRRHRGASAAERRQQRPPRLVRVGKDEGEPGRADGRVAEKAWRLRTKEGGEKCARFRITPRRREVEPLRRGHRHLDQIRRAHEPRISSPSAAARCSSSAISASSTSPSRARSLAVTCRARRTISPARSVANFPRNRANAEASPGAAALTGRRPLPRGSSGGPRHARPLRQRKCSPRRAAQLDAAGEAARRGKRCFITALGENTAGSSRRRRPICEAADTYPRNRRRRSLRAQTPFPASPLRRRRRANEQGLDRDAP